MRFFVWADLSPRQKENTSHLIRPFRSVSELPKKAQRATPSCAAARSAQITNFLCIFFLNFFLLLRISELLRSCGIPSFCLTGKFVIYFFLIFLIFFLRPRKSTQLAFLQRTQSRKKRPNCGAAKTAPPLATRGPSRVPEPQPQRTKNRLSFFFFPIYCCLALAISLVIFI